MIALVDGSTKRDAGALKCADMIAEIHQQCGVVWQKLQVRCKRRLERDSCAAVHTGLAVTDGLRLPYEAVAYPNKDDEAANHCNSLFLLQTMDQGKYGKDGENCEGGNQFQSEADVVKGKRPPFREVDRNAAVRDRQHVERQRQYQKKCWPALSQRGGSHSQADQQCGDPHSA